MLITTFLQSISNCTILAILLKWTDYNRKQGWPYSYSIGKRTKALNKYYIRKIAD